VGVGVGIELLDAHEKVELGRGQIKGSEGGGREERARVWAQAGLEQRGLRLTAQPRAR
jgi:hypothetical protein